MKNKTLHQALSQKKPRALKKHIQVTMSPDLHSRVEKALEQNGHSWQYLLHTALEVYLGEEETSKKRKAR